MAIARRGGEAAAYVRTHFSLARVAARYVDIYQGRSRQAARPRLARFRAAARLSPLLHWHAYADYRWGTGFHQYETARALAAAGEPHLAAAAMQTSLATSPTLFAKPARVRELARTLTPPNLRYRGSSMLTSLLRRFEVSPRPKAPKPCGTDEILDGRKPAQMGWYAFAADLFKGEEVLDVGCGSGEGLKLIAAQASRAAGIDLDDRLRRPDLDVEIKSIRDVPDKSFDNVVCFDVIEHVTEDAAFVADLFRVARKAVFITTPNYTMSRNRHPYHVREYTPAEFERLFRGYGALTLYAGSAHGFEQAVVRRRAAYFLVNALYTYTPTLLAAKILKRLLGVRIWKHNAALVRLPEQPMATGSSSSVATAA
jgi:SAM-dependent methyltransferase